MVQKLMQIGKENIRKFIDFLFKVRDFDWVLESKFWNIMRNRAYSKHLILLVQNTGRIYSRLSENESSDSKYVEEIIN
jgi:hypothetical protein